MTKPRPKQTVVLKALKHRDQDQIALHFRYDVALKAHLKRLQGVRWSRTHGCFYMPDSATQLTALRKHCQGSIWLDMTALSGRQPRSAEKKEGQPKENRTAATQ